MLEKLFSDLDDNNDDDCLVYTGSGGKSPNRVVHFSKVN